MADPASTIIAKLFERACADADSAPLAEAFASAYRDGQWNADALDAQVRSFVDQHARDVDYAQQAATST